jgi:hypothetical protein
MRRGVACDANHQSTNQTFCPEVSRKVNYAEKEGYVQYTDTCLGISTYKVGKILRRSRFCGGCSVCVAIEHITESPG